MEKGPDFELQWQSHSFLGHKSLFLLITTGEGSPAKYDFTECEVMQDVCIIRATINSLTIMRCITNWCVSGHNCTLATVSCCQVVQVANPWGKLLAWAYNTYRKDGLTLQVPFKVYCNIKSTFSLRMNFLLKLALFTWYWTAKFGNLCTY